MPPIPPVVGWTAVAVAVLALSRAVMKEWRRVNALLAAQRTPAQNEIRPEAIPTLRRDPRTGIYRPD
jgi:hypothetical protein